MRRMRIKVALQCKLQSQIPNKEKIPELPHLILKPESIKWILSKEADNVI